MAGNMVEIGHICESNACQIQYPDFDGDGKCVYQQLFCIFECASGCID